MSDKNTTSRVSTLSDTWRTVITSPPLHKHIKEDFYQFPINAGVMASRHIVKL